MIAMVSTPDGSKLFRTKITSEGEDEMTIGKRAATMLLEMGAQAITGSPPIW